MPLQREMMLSLMVEGSGLVPVGPVAGLCCTRIHLPIDARHVPLWVTCPYSFWVNLPPGVTCVDTSRRAWVNRNLPLWVTSADTS